jgi:RES domain-containing protein
VPEITVYRAADYRTPVRDVPSADPGRFHDEHSPATQYFGLHPLGPAAEVIRRARIERVEQVRILQRRMWALRLDLPDGFPALDFDSAADAGIDPEALISDEYAECQRFATRVRGEGWPGFIAPSAALPGTENIVVFDALVAIPYNALPLAGWEIPASMTVSRGVAPEDLLRLTRRFEQPHPAFEAWRNEEPYEFEEPTWEYRAVV